MSVCKLFSYFRPLLQRHDAIFNSLGTEHLWVLYGESFKLASVFQNFLHSRTKNRVITKHLHVLIGIFYFTKTGGVVFRYMVKGFRVNS